MTSWNRCLEKLMAAVLAWLMLATPAVLTAQEAAQPSPTPQSTSQAPVQAPEPNAQATPSDSAPPSTEALPDSPGALRSQSGEQGQTPAPQAPPPTPRNSTPAPVGTAAAGAVPSVGTAASEPAGVAIAPAKQRQSRALLIKVGAIVGAGVALGTVMALSNATSSKPPGAR